MLEQKAEKKKVIRDVCGCWQISQEEAEEIRLWCFEEGGEAPTVNFVPAVLQRVDFANKASRGLYSWQWRAVVKKECTL